MAEIEFWRDRNASLSALFEQLNLPIVHIIVKILSKAQPPIFTPLDFQLQELNKFYTEAKDNIKFLSTLERHFKNIITGSLGSVQVNWALEKILTGYKFIYFSLGFVTFAS